MLARAGPMSLKTRSPIGPTDASTNLRSKSCPPALRTACAPCSRSTTGTPPREVRWMCSLDTSEDDIDLFLAAIARETSTA